MSMIRDRWFWLSGVISGCFPLFSYVKSQLGFLTNTEHSEQYKSLYHLVLSLLCSDNPVHVSELF